MMVLEALAQVMAMGTLSQLLGTCAAMFFGALGAGLLPYILRVTEQQLSLVSSLGAGILIGSALAVIVPEGFEAYAAAGKTAGEDGALPEWAVGAALVVGFQAMLLLDSAQKALGGRHIHQHLHKQSPPVPEEAAESGLGVGLAPVNTKTSQQLKLDVASRALVGLLIHSAADGFAVGAASVSDSETLSTMVAIAMVLHKAPVAFGLATFLRASGWPWGRARQAMALFAAASPLAAAGTYALLSAVPALSSPAALALCVLFSGGTFLYAACVHILPEVTHGGAFTGGQAGLLTLGTGCPILLAAFHGGHHH